MSQRRSISFTENELDLLKYFDENGKSIIAKEALKFYRDNKNNVITEGMIKILKIINLNSTTPQTNQISKDKISKLFK